MTLFSGLIEEDPPEPIIGGSQFVRIKAITLMLSLSRPTIYRLVAKGEFPKPIKIGAGSFWVKRELIAWQAEKLASRSV